MGMGICHKMRHKGGCNTEHPYIKPRLEGVALCYSHINYNQFNDSFNPSGIINMDLPWECFLFGIKYHPA